MTAEEVKALIPIEQVLSSMYGLEVRQSMDCPVHGGDKCFSIKDGYFKCFSCNASGDIFQLVQELSSTDFAGAKGLICDYFNLKPSQNYTKAEKQAYRVKLEALKQKQERKRILKSVRNYQQDRICQTLRALQTIEGDTFPEKHLTALLRKYEADPEFFINHDILAHLKCLLYKYGTGTAEQVELINLYKTYGVYADMKIIIDSREQNPYTFTKQQYNGAITTQATLQTGDYSLAGLENLIALERKSLDDLTGTLTTGRERFIRECERGAGLEYFGLIIEASLDDIKNHNYRSKMTPQSLLQSLASFSVKYGLHIHFTGSREGGEYLTYSLLEKFITAKQKQLKTILQHEVSYE